MKIDELIRAGLYLPTKMVVRLTLDSPHCYFEADFAEACIVSLRNAIFCAQHELQPLTALEKLGALVLIHSAQLENIDQLKEALKS